jgi:mannose-6-phosphate isomerase-like protein (cupin superfamily)
MASASAVTSALLPAGASTTGSPICFIGKQMFVKIPASATAGEFSLLEDISPPRNGPPLHSHSFEEWFYVLTGNFLFEVDGRQVFAGPGDTAYVPPHLPHAFQNIGESEGGMLILARPGGVETYFQTVAAHLMNDPSDVAGLAALGVQYGVTVLGPPIGARKGQA